MLQAGSLQLQESTTQAGIGWEALPLIWLRAEASGDNKWQFAAA